MGGDVTGGGSNGSVDHKRFGRLSTGVRLIKMRSDTNPDISSDEFNHREFLGAVGVGAVTAPGIVPLTSATSSAAPAGGHLDLCYMNTTELADDAKRILHDFGLAAFQRRYRE
jgi:hypothetical protein